ncbi:MAG: protein-export chaperone SecB [gamma proteobacterium symbiont of Ctena orbiculata]|nr:protein-export chaperone SecB [Candidatus Thiodiazotropha taylori]MBT3060255.1 protein-export chaperone SecB [Candidatus Thiodiazotropha sp. (ex Lucina pensylvanica)]MBV2095771.1 protein-export chaperone SecB [Candidatus Thiodiazotropha sp. (ex Codakia orbicularis)]PUB74586.1 MAG: protein-export chaperone SecB [gamma proteobacterium symbiont of Ctena orbiculata]MBT3064640.1 protein-export chaperone SecB [Candidatus Thiodiazotropha sp. (ex Lucina pensylvanica)]
MTDAKQDEQNREFTVQRIYTKDISFETPNSPAVFQQEWKPETGVNLNTEVNKLTDTVYEVTLSVTVTTKVEDKTAYLAEVKQAGIFSINGFPEQELGPLLGAYCPNQLFPYVREAISDLIIKGSFPQMVLQPVNFDMLYAQHQQELAKKAQAESEAQH